MLIEFRVANFRSVKEEQVLSMVASKGGELEETNTFESGLSGVRLLPSAAIYGPNASGKTNLLFALRVMKMAVIESAVEKHRGDTILVEPFRLDSKSLNAPAKFEVVFMANGVSLSIWLFGDNGACCE